MKRRTQKINKASGVVFGGVLLVVAMMSIAVLAVGGEASAVLEYQGTADLEFTINEAITVTVAGDLTLDELAPGNYADSGIATVAVATNALGGYILQTTVGTSSGDTKLTNTSNSNYYFTSLGNESVASMGTAAAGSWGYSYSTDAGSTWSNYTGLPLDANSSASELGKGGATLVDTSSPLDNKSVKFKIGAKAAAAQALGDYTNTINFYAVTYAYSPSP